MEELELSKRNWLGILKKGGIFITILAVFLLAVSYGLFEYEQWRGKQGVKNLAEMFKKIEKDNYQRAMADTYGGKTPQETLQMYIDAVEKGDYELASKYLVEIKKNEEVQNLNSLKNKNNLQLFINIIKGAEPEGDIIGDTFRMRALVNNKKEGPYYFIRFIKYPNGIWKIIEI